jgi:hypothetical protein
VKKKSEFVPWLLIVASVIIALILGIVLLFEPFEPNLVVVFGFLACVLICFFVGSSLAFRGETVQKVLLLISLLLGSVLVFFLYLYLGVALVSSSPAWVESHPSAVQNMSIAVACVFVLASILAVAAIGVFVSIIRARRK